MGLLLLLLSVFYRSKLPLGKHGLPRMLDSLLLLRYINIQARNTPLKDFEEEQGCIVGTFSRGKRDPPPKKNSKYSCSFTFGPLCIQDSDWRTFPKPLFSFFCLQELGEPKV
ncbi:UNVERIFIED_CONTAM: hypothetical protein K2H54_045065 [Gekko kuhli]